MAPEMLARNGYGKAVDWWSLGALFFEMLTGSPPFTSKNSKDLDKKIMTENFNSPSYLTANAHSLLKGLLEKDVNKRLGATKTTMFKVGGISTLKQHPFFDDLDWHAIAKLEVKPPIDLLQIASLLGSTGDPTIHFHEGFTTQNISPSVIEESLSGVSSPARSRTNSKGMYNNSQLLS
jgi:p70 ribosomal S6 kinase